MKTQMKKKFIFIILSLFVSLYGNCQMVRETKQSPNPKIDPTVKITDMVLMDMKKITRLKNRDLTGGIISTSPSLPPSNNYNYGRIFDAPDVDGTNLKVFAYDPKIDNGKGPLLYGCFTDQKSKTYTCKAWTAIRGWFLDTYSNDIEKLTIKWVNQLKQSDPTYGGQIKNGKDAFEYLLPVIVEVRTRDDAYPHKFKIPGIGEYSDKELFSNGQITSLLNIYRNPLNFPNFIVLAAHRGYWKDVAENSKSAFEAAIKLGVEMLEIDTKLTKDSVVVISHDLHLGRLTNIPPQLANRADTNGHILVSKLTLQDIRPDKYPNPNNYKPVQLLDKNGQPADTMQTLEEMLLQAKGRVLVDIDKIESFFYDKVYKTALNTGTLKQIVVKGRYEKPDDLRKKVLNFNTIDWKNFMFTPVYFADFKRDDNVTPWDFKAGIDAFAKDPAFNCPGYELIYASNTDPLLQYINTIKNNNQRVIQFPQYPETKDGVYDSKKYTYDDIDPRFDRRNDWEWLLQKEHRPTLIITDRLEVLKQLLELKNLRNLNK